VANTDSITSACARSISSAPNAIAVAGSFGSNTSPTNDRVGNTLTATATIRRPSRWLTPRRSLTAFAECIPRSTNSPSRSNPATNINESYSHWRRKTW
jgi:hypothetical protein